MKPRSFPTAVLGLVVLVASTSAAPAQSSRQLQLRTTTFVFEGEQLVGVATGTGVAHQPMGSFGRAWSGGSQLFWRAAGPGAKLELRVNVPRAGNYDLTGFLTKAPDYGKFQVGANGQVGGEFDGYAQGVIHSGAVKLGTLQLNAGENQLIFLISGRHAASKAHFVGIDKLQLTPRSTGMVDMKPPVLSVRRFSGDFEQWISGIQVDHADELHFRVQMAGTLTETARYEVLTSDTGGKVAAKGTLGVLRGENRWNSFSINFKSLFPATPPANGMTYYVRVVVGFDSKAPTSNLVKVRYAPSENTITLHPGGFNESIDALLNNVRQKHNLPALAAAVVTTGGLGPMQAHGAVGTRENGKNVPVAINDLWHIGSCTKAMTATLAAVLVDRGLLSWETTVAEAFPDMADTMRPEFRAVTLAMLLSHRGGFEGGIEFNDTNYSGPLWDNSGPKLSRRARFAQAALSRAPTFVVGSYEYSNTGYVIAGAMLERRAGRTWEDLMSTELFQPLGITTAGFGPPGSASSLTQPRGHQDTDTGRISTFTDNAENLGPSGTVHISLRDWARFALFHMTGSEGSLRLQPATFQRLHTMAPGTAYALGWEIKPLPWGGGMGYYHGGTNGNWEAQIWVDPKRQKAIIAMTNLGFSTAPAGISEIIRELAATYIKP